MSAPGALSLSFSFPLICGRGRLTLLPVDLDLDVVVDAQDDQVADHVERAHGVEDIGVVEGDLLGHLDHAQDDHNVGARARTRSASLPRSLYTHMHTSMQIGWRVVSRACTSMGRKGNARNPVKPVDGRTYI